MPKRKFQSGRNYARQGGRSRKRMRFTRVPRGRTRNLGGLHYFKRTYQGSEITVNNVSAITGGLDFKLNQLPSYSEFTALFDEYRINGIRFEIVPLFTSDDLNPASTFLTLPNMHTVIDYDDSTTPADLNEMLQYPNRRMTRGNVKHVRYWKPKIASTVWNAGVASGYGATRMWIDCSNPGVSHYGLKWATDGNFGTGSQSITYKTYITMYIACRGVR